MARELEPIDVTDAPELLRLAEGVRRSNTPRLLRRDGEDIAVVVPIAARPPGRTKSRIQAQAGQSVAEATFGAVTPRRRPEDFRALRREFEESAGEGAAKETPSTACRPRSSIPTSSFVTS